MFNRGIVGLSVAALAAVTPASSSPGPTKGAFSTYCNAKYGYCVDYPSSLHGEGESDAADGQKFSSASDPMKIAAWATWSNWQSGTEMTVKQQRDWDLQHQAAGNKVTYSAAGKSWFVLSGNSKEDIFYQRTIKGKDTFATVLITYPSDKKAAYANVVQRLARSLKAD